MDIVVIDTETTGIDAEKDRVVEVAAARVSRGVRGRWGVGLVFLDQIVDPGVPIPPDAMGVHHILERDVRGKPMLSQVLARGLAPLVPFIPAAHYAKFDSGFVGLEEMFDAREVRWICTWRCAQHIWPEAPSYSNQTLRYWLGLFREPYVEAMPPHRARADVVVTAHVLARMLTVEGRTPEELLELTIKPVLQKVCRFGKHRGEEWSNVPRDYLRWILSKPEGEFDPDVVYTARHHHG